MALRIIDILYPETRKVYAVVATMETKKLRWWGRPKPYILLPVLYWGITAKHNPKEGIRTNDEVAPFVRFRQVLEDAREIGGFVGLAMPGDNPDMFLKVIGQWREAMAKVRDEREAEAAQEQKAATDKLLN